MRRKFSSECNFYCHVRIEAAGFVTFGIGVVSLPLLLLLPALKGGGTEPSCWEGELRDSGDGAFGFSSGWAKAVASTKSHQNFISSRLPLFHRISAATFHSFAILCSQPTSLFVSLPLLSSLGRLSQRTDHRACVARGGFEEEG